ncbi:hypothetical protein [uncultured Sulfitobacter sp.]|nr:hypothetical protein [uncultured Sulfitobacter sp.]
MEFIIIVIAAVTVIGIAATIYEWKKKRTLLQHDLNLQACGNPHTHAAKVHAEDVIAHRISGFDR